MSATFSTVVVVRNEEACDERTLATKIVPQAWIPHMEWARNRGIELATGDWILVVDADEGHHRQARRASPRAGGDRRRRGRYWIPRMSCWFGHRLPHIGGYPDHQLRCFRRGAGLYPDRLHSHPEIDGRTLFMPAEADAWILHERDGQTIGDLAGLVLSVLFAFYRFEVEVKAWEAAGYWRDADATVRGLRSLPRMAAALTGHGLGRLWARRSSR